MRVGIVAAGVVMVGADGGMTGGTVVGIGGDKDWEVRGVVVGVEIGGGEGFDVGGLGDGDGVRDSEKSSASTCWSEWNETKDSVDSSDGVLCRRRARAALRMASGSST